jgi:hypothetical protein
VLRVVNEEVFDTKGKFPETIPILGEEVAHMG